MELGQEKRPKGEGKEGGKSDTDKLLDAVEAKMRVRNSHLESISCEAEMEEQQRRAKSMAPACFEILYRNLGRGSNGLEIRG